MSEIYHFSPKRLLISHEEIIKRIQEISVVIEEDYRNKTLVLVIILKGAICFAADLIRHLTIPFTVECVSCKSYGMRGSQRGLLTVLGLEALAFTNTHVLVLDDVFDSGETLRHIKHEIIKKNPISVKTLVLLSKDLERATHTKPDYELFRIQNEFVVGYGLDYKEQLRGLNGIYVMNPEGLL